MQQWELQGAQRRQAAVSSFGFSGTNAHLVIEEYAGQKEEESPRSGDRAIPQMIVLSARDSDRLREYAEVLAEFVEHGASEIALDELAYTLQIGREPMEERLGFVANSIEDVGKVLKAFLADGADGRSGAEPPALYVGHVKRDRRVASAFTADEDLPEDSSNLGSTGKVSQGSSTLGRDGH